jgi:hypothetical protein
MSPVSVILKWSMTFRIWNYSCPQERGTFSGEIGGFHRSDYEEWCLLGCYAVWLLQEQTFQRNLAAPSSAQRASVASYS